MSGAEFYSEPTSGTARGIDWKASLPTVLILCSTSFLITLSVSNTDTYLQKFWVILKNNVASQGKPSKRDHLNNRDVSKKHKRFEINSSEDEAWPQIVKEMWRDRRHSRAWYTFWIAVLVASLTVTFALLQVAHSNLFRRGKK